MSENGNAVERIKAAKDGLAALDDLPALAAHEGWETIAPDDRERLKWTGWFYRKPTPRRFMVRVRVTGGRLDAAQLEALAGIADLFGSGLLDLTTRQGVEIRDARIADAPEIHRRLEAVGLTSLQTGMDNVRAVMTCPLAGVAADEVINPFPVAEEVTRSILRNRAFTNLPRKVNVTVTGCPHNCTPAETQDVALVPARTSDGVRGWNVLVGGKMGSGGMTAARPLDVFVGARTAAALVRAVLEVFRDHGPRRERNRCRLAFLVEAWGLHRLRLEVERRLGRPVERAGKDLRWTERDDHLGVRRQRDGRLSVGFSCGTGRVKSADLRAWARLARSYGSGEIRLTPDQNAVLVNVPDERLEALRAEEVFARFPIDPGPFHRGLVTCAGTDYCNLALIDTKGIGERVSRALAREFGTDLPPLRIHWSGCPAGCGNHKAADLGFQGLKTMVAGKPVEAVHVYLGGTVGPHTRPARRILEAVPVRMLPEIVPMIVRNWALLRRSREAPDEGRIIMIPSAQEATL